MNYQRIKTVAYWITTILGPASFIYGGVLHLARRPEVVTTLAHLGYPAYFATILGLAKVLGALAVVIPRFPRLKEWAYAGFFFDLAAAAASRAFVGDPTPDILAPLVFMILVGASWALRPASRKLPSRATQTTAAPVGEGRRDASPAADRPLVERLGQAV